MSAEPAQRAMDTEEVETLRIGARQTRKRDIPACYTMGSHGHRAPVWATALASGALLVLAGCAEITGVDEYGVRDDGNEPAVTACPAGQAPAGEGGGCEEVGVVDCGNNFEQTLGGCAAILPPSDCDPGLLARPGQTQCLRPGNCFPRYFGALPEGTWLYVDAAANEGGDGKTEDTPFKTIMEAVRAAAPGTTGIVIARGEYVEQVEITAPLTIFGACPRAQEGETATILRAPDGTTGPVVHITPSATSVHLRLLQIVGGTAGLAAEGPVELSFSGLWIRDVEGPGIALGKDVTASAAGSLVENALGAGILLEGATLEAGIDERIAVRGTRANGQEGYGIALYPSGELTGVSSSMTAPYRLSSTSSKLTLHRSVLEGNVGAALFVEGSTAVVTQSVIRNTYANGLGAGRGVVVQQRAFGPIPASLELKQTVIEGSADVGVLIVDSPALSDGTPGVRAVIENTTIRDIAGVERAVDGAPCLGNGLHVRADRPSSDEPAIVLKNSLIEGAREAGVHVQGARVQIAESIVRGTRACSGDFGDGIAVLGDERLRAAVSIVGSRIENSARAGVASFGADVSVISSVIETSGAIPLARIERGGAPATVNADTSACGLQNASTRCRDTAATLAPPLVGGNGCEVFEAQGVCYSICWDSVAGRLNAFNAPDYDASQSVAPLPGSVLWAPDALEFAAAIADEDGCTEWGGLPPNAPPQVWAHGLDGFMPAAWWQTTGSNNSIPARSVATPNVVNPLFLEPTFNALRSPLDTVIACLPADPEFANRPTEPCVGRGVEGLRLEAESPGAAGPTYVSADGAPQSVAPELAITRASYGSFVNALPGDFVVRILPPVSGGRVHCTGDAFGKGWSSANLRAPDIVQMPARRGFNAASIVFCELR